MRRRISRAAGAALLLPLAACGVFVTHAEPFTPDAPPVSEVVARGRDTVYVVRTPAYVLEARDRALLWNRGALDDAVWRYRWLFGRAPSPVAVRVDTTAAPWPAEGTDAGLPTVRVRLRAAAASAKADTRGAPPAGGWERSALALRTARAWLGADADSATGARLPWWFEAGALRILAGVAAEPVARGGGTDPQPLATLLAAARPSSDSAPIARLQPVRRNAARAIGPSVAADAASLLTFLRERDPSLLTRLPEQLRAGRTLPELLGGGKVPATVPELESEWRKWLRKRPADARAVGAGA